MTYLTSKITTRRSRVVGGLCCLAWLLVLALPSPAFADLWYEHYSRAEKALRAGEWATAVEELNEAIARKGDSGRRIRTYGMKFTEYFPYLKLGIAYFELGQLDAAAHAFETEERLAAITEADRAYGELRDYRRRIDVERRDLEAEQQKRRRQIVAESLAESLRLERLGQLEDAIEALGRAQAVDAEASEVQTALGRLRAATARQEEERRRAARVAELTAEGRRALERGEYGDAARAFRQALAEDDVAELRTLLAEAQEALRTELEDQDAARRQEAVRQALSDVRALRSQGRLEEALARLEGATLLDPENEAALELRRQLLEARQREEVESTREAAISDLRTQAEAELTAGRAEKALAIANRLLALDSGNRDALTLVSRSYQAISRALLGAAVRENVPPAIRFADFRQESPEGPAVERVRRPDFRWSGVVIDDGPVELAFYAGDVAIDGHASLQEVGEYHIAEFNLEHRLTSGPLAFRLVATDAEGLIASSTYHVEYLRPFYRAPAFYAALVSLAVVAVATAAGTLYRRRVRLRRRRFNPYVAGAPILEEDLFFGRRELLERILQTIHNNSLLLYGERRIGKTSIQHQLMRRLRRLDDPHYEFHPVYIDLQGTPQERFFATLAEEIFLELGEATDLEPTAADAYGYRELVRDLRRILAALREKSAKRVRLVLLIDEVDELNEYDPKVNQRLRSLFMKSFAENLVAVVSGVSIKKEWRREASPWYNFFEEIEVHALRPEEARELVERPMRGLVKWEPGVVEEILARTDAKPYLVQKLCMALVRRLYEENRKTVTLADVEEVVD